ncbi:Methyltransferase domain-containing protein [Alteromonadaceae bacterium Bs31]|nr:Methyltransferase domain-containing protein [Alteromonadaceae bacterium Bs31]
MRTTHSNPAIDFFQEHNIKGFLEDEEGLALFDLALKTLAMGPCLEIGSYCGRSTVFIGKACKQLGNTLYAVDHHRGSEEHQQGEQYHDKALFNEQLKLVDSFPAFRRTLSLAQLESVVVPLVASSELAARHWKTPLGLVFIDGGHSPEMSREDCFMWAEKLALGAYMAIHDIYEKPEDGGQGPFLAMQALLQCGKFTFIEKVCSLGVIKKIVN